MIPKGWKLVPEEPTNAMFEALYSDPEKPVGEKWDAMLAASPQAPLPEERRFDCHLIQDAPPYHWNTCKAWCGDFRCPQEERRDKERRCAPSPREPSDG